VGEEPQRDWLYQIITSIEGHGDNVAAAILGGLVAVGSDGPRSLPISEELLVVAGVPDVPLATKQAREELPREVSLGTAARSVARAVALVEGLRTGDPAALAAAGGDELHEAPRAALSPVTGDMIEAARSAGALHAAWSGAGPTAIALTTADDLSAVVAAFGDVLGDRGDVRTLGVDRQGLI
jgi:homoserine kinase